VNGDAYQERIAVAIVQLLSNAAPALAADDRKPVCAQEVVRLVASPEVLRVKRYTQGLHARNGNDIFGRVMPAVERETVVPRPSKTRDALPLDPLHRKIKMMRRQLTWYHHSSPTDLLTANNISIPSALRDHRVLSGCTDGSAAQFVLHDVLLTTPDS